MSTLILILCLVLLACIVVGAVAVTAVLLIHLWRCVCRADTYEPAAAEAPDLDAAFADARRIVRGRIPTPDVEHLVGEFDWHAAEHMMGRTR